MAVVPVEGGQLFNQRLNLDRPLCELIKDAYPFDVDSPLAGKFYLPDDNLVLRNDLGENDELIGREIVSSALEHLAKLKNMGLCVLSHTIELGPNPDMNHESEPPYLYYCASKYVSNMVPLHLIRDRTPKFNDLLRKKIIGPVLDYLDWTDETQPKWIMDDIYTPDQFAVDKSSGEAFLHDIEPKMTLYDPDNSRGYHYKLMASFSGLLI